MSTPAPSSRPWPVAVVGVGAFGARHAAHWAAIPEVELVGVCDVDRGRAEQVAAEVGCAVLRDLHEVAARAELVSVAVPTERHADVAAALLDAELHVLVEKPLAATPDDAFALFRLARTQRRILGVGHVERFNPAVRAVRAIAVRPRRIEALRLGPFPTRAGHTDVVTDWMIHDLDLVTHLAGAGVSEYAASGARLVSDHLDAARVTLWLRGAGRASGVTAELVARRTESNTRRQLRLVAEDADYLLDLARGTLRVARSGRAPLPVPVVIQDPLRSELRAFVRAVEGRAPAAFTDAGQGAEAVALAHAVRDVAATRHRRHRSRAATA